MRKLLRWPLLILALLILVAPVYAVDVSGSLYLSSTIATNLTGTADTNVRFAFPLVSSNLISESFMESDGLNSAIQNGGVDTPYMPGSKINCLESVLLYNGATYSDQTATSCSGGTVNLMDATPATGDAVELGLHNQGRVAYFDITTAGVGTYSVTWQYCFQNDCNSAGDWASLSNVVDSTEAWTLTGTHSVTFDAPTTWPAIAHQGVTAYWVRARLTYTSASVKPIANTVYYETGLWWLFADAIGAGAQVQNDIYAGGPDMQTFFPWLPGELGAVTPDDAGMEPGNNWRLEFDGYFATDGATGTDVSVAFKEEALNIYVSGVDEITVSATATAAPATSSFYAGTQGGWSQQNATYATAHDAATGSANGCNSFEADSCAVGQFVTAGPLFSIYRSILSFDTSSLPDTATITGATLKLYGKTDQSTTDFTLTAESVHAPPYTTADYAVATYGTDRGTFATSGWSTAGYNSITIATAAVSTTVTTDLGLRSSRDISSTSPVNQEYVTYYQAGHANQPILEVTYTVSTTTLDPIAVPAGYHNMVVANDTINITVTLDSTIVATFAPLNVDNTANAWNWAIGGSMPYVNYIKESVGGVQQLWYQFNDLPAVNFLDRSGNGNASTLLSFPDQPANYQIVTGFQAAIQDVTDSGVGSGDVAAPVTPPANFMGGDGTGLPFNPLVQEISSAAQLPGRLNWIILAVLTTVGAGMVGLFALKTPWAAFGAILFMIALWSLVASPIFPFWLFFPTFFGGLAVLLVARKMLNPGV